MGKISRRELLVEEFGLEDSKVFSEEMYDSAIVGYDANEYRIIYDYEKLAECLMAEGMDYDDALDYIGYNMIRSLPYTKGAPIVLCGIEDYLDCLDDEKKEYKFDVEQTHKEVVESIRDWFESNGKDCNAVIGISGGKDSTIVAALCAEALGKERVIGVAMPDKGQCINDADKICEHIGIRYMCMPIDGITSSFDGLAVWSTQSEQNIPPRARMTMLYAIAQSNNGRVVGTCNKSERYIGYFTKFGDGASDLEPIGNLTVTELKALGRDLNLPIEWVDKTPDDGLPFSSPDEEKLGFTYEELDRYIRMGVCEDEEKKEKIIRLHNKNLFKLNPLDVFPRKK